MNRRILTTSPPRFGGDPSKHTLKDDESGSAPGKAVLEVIGIGWIWLPADTDDPGLIEFSNITGKANFGFVSKYMDDATVPSGQTEFQFKGGELSFHSTEYQWLMVAGARVQFKGGGTLNGKPGYGFMLTAIDGDKLGDGQPDRVRIKIWEVATDAMVYDNQAGADDTADLVTPGTLVQGGNIMIYK